MSTKNVYETKAWKKLQELYGEKISSQQLRTLAIIINKFVDVKLTRENKRTKAELIKWYDENYDVVFPFMISKIIIIKD